MGEVWPILVIGGGPAGLSAAINARKRNKEVLVLAKEQISHKLASAPKVENYPGVTEVSGDDLGKRLYEHALAMGVVFRREEAQQVYRDDDVFWVMGREGQFKADKVLLAIGVTETRDIPGEHEWVGRGVSYCATCDGAFYKGLDVAMISHLPEAEGEASFLAGLCRKVYYIPQYAGKPGSLGENVEVIRGRPQAIEGDEKVCRLVLNDRSLDVDGVFIERPGVPPASLIEGLAVDGDRIVVNENMETSIPGLYAAGDCTGRPWQIARAVGQGQVAAISMARILDERLINKG